MRVEVALVLLVLGIAACPVSADDGAYRDRGNRIEGILDATNVSGYRLDLLGIRLRPARALEANAERMYLLVMAPVDDFERVVVDEPRSNYRMQPRRGDTGRDPSDCGAPLAPRAWFCWPTATVIRSQRVPISRLLGSAVDTAGRHYPVLLATEDAVPSHPVFVFSLHAAGELAGTWRVTFEGDGQTDLGRGEVPAFPPGVGEIVWDPEQSLAAGWYRFRVGGRLYTDDGISRVRLDKQFFFDPDILHEQSVGPVASER